MTDPRIEAALAAYCREPIEEPIELVMAKVLAAADAAAWRPIETAPRDGTYVDLWVIDDVGKGRRFADSYFGPIPHTCGEYGQYCDSCPEKGKFWIDGIFGHEIHGEITHWQPLPSPPTPSGTHPMTITAKSVLASVSPDGKRIDTLLLRYPRFIHAEFMTHRQFSRNASSSRAIPVARLIEDIEADPVYPSFWGKNRPGMQAKEELTFMSLGYAHDAWEQALQNAITTARALAEIGAHKQIVNRILEPFAHINVVVTATEWENFFGLRIHDDAQPEILALAVAMKEAMERARVQILGYCNWHLPFVSTEEIAAHGGLSDPTGILRTVSAARCARTSYKTHDGRVSTIEEDKALGERLTASRPFHASPFEQQAKPDMLLTDAGHWLSPNLHRNFKGWIQNRALMEESL